MLETYVKSMFIFDAVALERVKEVMEVIKVMEAPSILACALRQPNRTLYW